MCLHSQHQLLEYHERLVSTLLIGVIMISSATRSAICALGLLGREPVSIAQELKIDIRTVRRWMGRPHATRQSRKVISLLDPFKASVIDQIETRPFSARKIYQRIVSDGFTGSFTILKDYLSAIRPGLKSLFDGEKWLFAVVQQKIDLRKSHPDLDHIKGLDVLLERLKTGRLSDRNKSLTVLGCGLGIKANVICTSLGITFFTYKRYQRLYTEGGNGVLFAPRASKRKADDAEIKALIFKILHEPPSNHGINRTSWTMPLLRQVMKLSGKEVSPDIVRSIIHAAGYRWKKARIVLTSNDPDYSRKLANIQSILFNLQPDEVFFSIDEYGPFTIRMYGGKKLVEPGEQLEVPQWQKSRGTLILTAALELSSNQISFFYSAKKNTDEMMKMMDQLVIEYANRRKLYLSWDAASWHIAKRLNQKIDDHNARAASKGGVIVETAPLPAGAQFLNVIESVFSGMSRAIIHHSDYPSIDTAKSAIERYFRERNEYFQINPQRAGKKIWGKERVPPEFSDASNCKDPRYR